MMNRRQFFLASAVAAGTSSLKAQSGDLPDMLLKYFTQRFEAARPKVPPSPAEIRRALREITGPYPQPTRQSARVAKTTARDGYHIENVLFESRPDYWVTANIWIPSGASKAPAIVMPRGHFDPDRMLGDYQQIAFDLVRAGFVVLSYDPIGQGPRRQRWSEPGAKFDGLISTSLEHALIGNKLALLGESVAGWQVRDGMAAVDYLMTRPEVDAARIGCADHSDTGAESALLCAIDERIGCAVLHAARFGHRWPPDPTTWIVVDDTQEYLPGAALQGIDVCETFAALTPRPLLILRENLDGGFDSAIGQLHERYRTAGDPAKFAVQSADSSQTWPARLRLETVAWFSQWFRTTGSPKTETDVIPVTGLRETCPGKSAYELIRDRAAEIRPAKLTLERLQRVIRPNSGKREPAIILNSTTVVDLRIDGLQIPCEPGIRLPAKLVNPVSPNGKVVVYVTGDVTKLDPVTTGDDVEDPAPPDRTPEKLAANGYIVLAVDVRGIGAMAPRIPRRGFRVPYHHLMNRDMALNMMAWALGDSLFAMRVRDLLQAVDHASTLGEVWVAGKDMGATWAVFAGALDRRVTHVIAQNGPASWRSLIENDRFHQASSQIHWGILKELDIPDVAGLIAPRRLTILDQPGETIEGTATPDAKTAPPPR